MVSRREGSHSQPRQRHNKKQHRSIWIFCEGEFERTYFECLRDEYHDSGITIKADTDTETNALGVIQFAVKQLEQLKKKENKIKEGDQFWCAFDRDDNSDMDIERALSLAKQNELQIAFSNPCFEIWLLLHFEYSHASLNTAQAAKKKLTKKLPDYTEDAKIVPIVQDDTKTEMAIANAMRLHEFHKNDNTAIYSRQSDPVTTVYLLIRDILAFAKAYNNN